MTEFNMAYHHNVVVKRKKRLTALMMLDNPTDLYDNEDSDTTLRQYLGQYTYIDYKADDWLDKLLYALPLHGLLQSNEDNEDNIQLVNVQVHWLSYTQWLFDFAINQSVNQSVSSFAHKSSTKIKVKQEVLSARRTRFDRSTCSRIWKMFTNNYIHDAYKIKPKTKIKD